VIYIRQYTAKFLDDIDIKCGIEIAEHIPQIKVTGNNRRNIFLVVKEALNNIVKHAAASEVKLKISFDDALHVSIHDNGKGIPETMINNSSGNGVANMCKRMRQLDSDLQIVNSQGTTVAFSIPLQKPITRKCYFMT
jgi:signal transduction histidine kinase